jgi:hypothetical protein
MTAARIILALVVVSTGLFTGLVLYIVGLFQPLLTKLSGAEFTVVMDRFLPAARKNLFNYLFTLTTLLGPVAALILLRDHTNTAMFWLTLAGWLATRAPYYRINAIRTTGSLAALVLFVAALAQPTP